MSALEPDNSNVRPPMPHKVTVSLGYTRNMGNFESLRVDIGLEASSYGDPAGTFKKVYDWTEEKLIEKVEEVEKQVRGVTGTKGD